MSISLLDILISSETVHLLILLTLFSKFTSAP